MRKLSILFAAAAAFLTASCSQENLESHFAGQEVNISFTAQLPGSLATKAYADGLSVDQLYYAVYNTGETNPVYVPQEPVEITGKSANVHLKLVSGKTYDILFWAQDADNKTYRLALDGQTITVDYAQMKSNDETNDAFYAFRTYEVKGAVNEIVGLTRPFAQINLGTNDLAGINDDSFNLTKSSMKATVANVLNLATGAVSGEAEVEYAANLLPVESKDGSFPVAGYTYLAMNYVLVGKDQTTTNCEFSVYEGESTTATNTIAVSNIPVKRNFRTNIYGSLITDPGDFDVNVNPDFGAGDTNIDFVKVATIDDVKGAIKSGVYDVNVQNAPTSDGNVILPAVASENVGKEVTISLPATEYTVTFSYETATPEEGMGNIKNVKIITPNAKNIVINLPESHVTLNGIVATATVSTSQTTFVVAEGANISKLYVNAGNVEVKDGGKVISIENLSDVTVYLMGEADEIGENIVVLPKYVEDGVFMGYGIPMKGFDGLETMWAPVNVGYHPVERPYGLYFQFGRKDGQTYLGDLPVSNYVQLTAEILGEDGVNDNPDPNTFYISTNSNPKVVQDWYTFEYEKQVSNFWDKLQTGDKDPIFSSFGPLPEKGENDPCPDGWRIPTYNENYSIIDVGGGDAPKRTWGEGMHGESKVTGRHYHGYYGHYLFLPASGCISANGVSEMRGQQVYGWSSTTNTEYHNHRTGIGFYQESSGGRSYAAYRAEAYPVRCVYENYKPETNQYPAQ